MNISSLDAEDFVKSGIAKFKESSLHARDPKGYLEYQGKLYSRDERGNYQLLMKLKNLEDLSKLEKIS